MQQSFEMPTVGLVTLTTPADIKPEMAPMLVAVKVDPPCQMHPR